MNQALYSGDKMIEFTGPYIPATTPRAHQAKAKALTINARLYAYLAEMGTGKTKMVLDEWAQRVWDGRSSDLLILAPAGSYRNWLGELSKHISAALFRCISSCVWQSGAGVTDRKRLELFLALRNKPRVFIVNIEALSSTVDAPKACRTFLDVPGRKAMLVVDESTTIKNGSAGRTKEVMALRDYAATRRILTGLITPRSPLDLFSQFEFLDWRILGHESLFTFKRRYCILETIRVKGEFKSGKKKGQQIKTADVVVGYRNLDELQKKIAPYSYRVLKSECLDLPPKIYMKREVQLTKEQKKIYNDLVLFSTAELDNEKHVTTNMVITKLMRLHQIVCGHSVDEEEEEHDIPSNRISEMMSVLEEHSGKVIVWTNYRKEISKIVKALENEYGSDSVAQFHGGNRRNRASDERLFLSDPQCRFMVATQSAGGRGNTWVNANLVIYFSNSYDLEMRMQSEDRSHRDGLKHAVTYVDLVTPGTIDEKILKALRKKLNMATLISGEKYREWLI